MKIATSNTARYRLILFVTLLCLWFSIIPLRVLNLMIFGNKVLWTVTDTEIIYNEDDEYKSNRYYVFAKYDCWSEIWIEWKSVIASSEYHYRIGETLLLYCSEKHPKNFVPISIINYILLIFPCLFSILPLIGIRKIVRDLLRKRLKKTGIKVEATIEEIASGMWSFNGQPWFKIRAKSGDNVFLSEEFFADIDKMFKKWDKIDVYVDSWNYSKYWIDIDSVFEKIDAVNDAMIHQ